MIFNIYILSGVVLGLDVANIVLGNKLTTNISGNIIFFNMFFIKL